MQTQPKLIKGVINLNINTLLELKDSLDSNMPDKNIVKKACEELTGQSREYAGYNVQAIMLYLLDFYIVTKYHTEAKPYDFGGTVTKVNIKG